MHFAEAIFNFAEAICSFCENIDQLSPVEAGAGTELGNKPHHLALVWEVNCGILYSKIIFWVQSGSEMLLFICQQLVI